MTLNRRHFLTAAGTAGIGLAMGVTAPMLAASTGTAAAGRSAGKRLLVLGGTGFIGPPMVRYAVERGHEVTIFTRGRTKTGLPDVEHLIGDRTGDLEALKGRSWDVVLDNNARDYRWVKLTTELLKDQVEHYLKLVLDALEAGLEKHVLLSHDRGWYRPGEPDGGASQVRGFTYLSETFLPRLRQEGVDEASIKLMTEINPKRAFRMRKG